MFYCYRTRLLDCWIKDVLYSYQIMNQSQQHAVKVFLGLNREHNKTYYLQEKLMKGQVEAPRATYGIASRGTSMSESVTQTPPRTPRGDVSDTSESQNSPSTYILSNGNSSGVGTGTTTTATSAPSPSRPPLRKKNNYNNNK